MKKRQKSRKELESESRVPAAPLGIFESRRWLKTDGSHGTETNYNQQLLLIFWKMEQKLNF